MGKTTEEYKEIICLNYKEIYRFALYLTDDSTAAEDLTQEIFMSAWANADTYKAESSIKTWLHRIAYHKFIDSKRKIKRYDAFLDKYEENKIRTSSNDFDPLQKITADEDSRDLYEAMHKLNETDYLCILLHYIQELSFREIARILNRPAGTVKWQVNRAIKRLRNCFSD